MSRSNNTEIINPANRWFEWSGNKGNLKYYDKDAKINVEVSLPFTFIVLDQLATVKGWHDPSDSGIYSNEVKDTTKDPIVVKAFKGGVIAEGFYRDIKDKVKSNGGHFVANIYIAYKDKDIFYIGSIQFKGAALNSWADFSKRNRKDIMQKAVVIEGFETGQKGSVKYTTPKFGLKEISAGTQEVAIDLDKELQEYLTLYLQRKPVSEQIENKSTSEQSAGDLSVGEPSQETPWQNELNDDLPF